MTNDRDMAAGVDPNRYLNRARAALREAAECLEDAGAASEHPSLSVASALSHVVSARKVLRPQDAGESRGAPERDVA